MQLGVDSDFFAVTELIYKLATKKITYEQFALELGRLVAQLPVSLEVLLYLAGAIVTLVLYLRLLKGFRSRFENDGSYVLLVATSTFGTYLLGIGVGNLHLHNLGKYLLIGCVAALMFCLLVRRSRKEFDAGESYRIIPILCLVALCIVPFLQSGIQWYEVLLVLVLLLFLPELVFGIDAHAIKLTMMFSFMASGVMIQIVHVLLRIAAGFGLDVRVAVGAMLVSVPLLLVVGLTSGLAYGLWSLRQPLADWPPVSKKPVAASGKGGKALVDPLQLTFSDWEVLTAESRQVMAEMMLQALKDRNVGAERRSRDHVLYEIDAILKGWRENKGVATPTGDCAVLEQLLKLEGCAS